MFSMKYFLPIFLLLASLKSFALPNFSALVLSLVQAPMGVDDREVVTTYSSTLRKIVRLVHRNGKSSGTCTAFSIGPHLIATAAHCVEENLNCVRGRKLEGTVNFYTEVIAKKNGEAFIYKKSTSSVGVYVSDLYPIRKGQCDNSPRDRTLFYPSQNFNKDHPLYRNLINLNSISTKHFRRGYHFRAYDWALVITKDDLSKSIGTLRIDGEYSEADKEQGAMLAGFSTYQAKKSDSEQTRKSSKKDPKQNGLALTFDKNCGLTEFTHGNVIHDCYTHPGASGSPLLINSETLPRVIGIHVAAPAPDENHNQASSFSTFLDVYNDHVLPAIQDALR